MGEFDTFFIGSVPILLDKLILNEKNPSVTKCKLKCDEERDIGRQMERKSEQAKVREHGQKRRSVERFIEPV